MKLFNILVYNFDVQTTPTGWATAGGGGGGGVMSSSYTTVRSVQSNGTFYQTVQQVLHGPLGIRTVNTMIVLLNFTLHSIVCNLRTGSQRLNCQSNTRTYRMIDWMLAGKRRKTATLPTRLMGPLPNLTLTTCVSCPHQHTNECSGARLLCCCAVCLVLHV